MEDISGSANRAPPAQPVLTLKVHKRDAGKKFPFDKVYLFKEGVLPLMKQAFPFCLVFRLNSELLRMLSQLTIHRLVVKTRGRKDMSVAIQENCAEGLHAGHSVLRSASVYDALTEGTLHRDFLGAKEVATEFIELLNSFWKSSGAAEQEVITKDCGWYQLVPVLPRYHKSRRGEDAKLSPLYLTNRRWQQTVERKLGYRDSDTNVPGGTKARALPDDALLVLNGSDELDPPCLACGHLMYHLQGECEIGGRSCYSSMSFGDRSYFKRGLAMRELLKKMSLEEAYTAYMDSFKLDSNPTSEGTLEGEL